MTTDQTPKINRFGSQSGLAQTARGRWSEVLSVLAPELEMAIDAHTSRTPHVPCPNHGGKDGFRLFSGGGGTSFNETGGGICNTCGPVRDGFRMLTWIYAQREHGEVEKNFEMGKYPTEMRKAYSDVAFYLEHGYAKNPELRNRVARVVKALTPEEIAQAAEIQKKRKEQLMMLGQRMWQGGVAMDPLIAKYFADRGSSDVVLSEVMRLNPNTPYIADTGTTYHPTILMPVSRVEDGKTKIIALHRIYLHEHEDGRVTKGLVDEPKKIMPWGNLEGAAIRLYPITGKILAVGEGVETMVSVHTMSGLPTWSCVTAWGLENVQIPDDVEVVLIAEDYDVSKKGQESSAKLAARVQAMGKTAVIMSPKDFYNPAKHLKGVDWDDAYKEDPARARLMWEPYMEIVPPSLDASQ